MEVAFHDNPEDAKWILENIEPIGTALAKGLLKYFRIPLQEEMLTVIEAVEILKEKGIIYSPDYWVENAVEGKAVKGEYADLLMQRAALILKGGV